MSHRLRFANQLRGLAAAGVVFSHLVGVYWLIPDVVSAVTGSPPQAGPPPAILPLAAYPWFNFGPFGVAVFFLISGLVIPFSVMSHTRRSFVLARLLRIFPTYAAALLIELAAVHLSAHAWDRPLAVTSEQVVTNALLVYDLVGQPILDLVNWTLSVELKFYLLAVLLFPALRDGRLRPVLAAAAALLAVNLLMATGWVGDVSAPQSSPSHTISFQSTCLLFMLIAVPFNFHSRGLLSSVGLVLTAGLLACGFLLSWRLGVWASQYTLNARNYLYALALFAGFYAARRHVPPNPLLDGLAAISFPLYLLHSLLGYTALRALMNGAGLGYGSAMAVTLPVLCAVAYILHRAVERPTVQAGRRLGFAPGEQGPSTRRQHEHAVIPHSGRGKPHPLSAASGKVNEPS